MDISKYSPENNPRKYAAGVVVVATTAIACNILVDEQPQPAAPEVRISQLSGGCDSFVIYSKNRNSPGSTPIRLEPRLGAQQIDSAKPNRKLRVNAWVATGTPTYPGNEAPYDSDVWYHIANGVGFDGNFEGWISFAGVRATRSELNSQPDPSNTGIPAPLPPECKGTYLPQAIE